MQIDYGYPNARIKAMKSLLFDHAYYEALLDVDDVQEIIAALEKTSYKKDIEEGTLKYPGVQGVEEGLRMNLVNTFRKVVKIADESGSEVRELVHLLVGRWDVYNIKTIVRGKHIGATREEILDSLIPAGELHAVLLKQLAEAKDMKECLDLLAVWEVPYGRPLTAEFSHYVETGKLADMELALDKFAYQYALERTKRMFSLNARLVREIFQREIDFVNIMTIIRLSRERVDPEEAANYFIEGGKLIDLEKFLSLVQIEKPEEIVAQLQETPYWGSLSEGLQDYLKYGSIAALERSMEDLIVKKNVAMFKGDPLSIAVIIGYVWAKFNEVVNLRILIRGKSVGIPKERIKKDLVFA